jgi:hypothetical protein
MYEPKMSFKKQFHKRCQSKANATIFVMKSSTYRDRNHGFLTICQNVVADFAKRSLEAQRFEVVQAVLG